MEVRMEGSGAGCNHMPYLGVTVVISLLGYRMWQVVMVYVDWVWGRLLTEWNTGTDRRHGVNAWEGQDSHPDRLTCAQGSLTEYWRRD